MALTSCKACGAEVSSDSRFCSRCGKPKPSVAIMLLGMNAWQVVGLAFLVFIGLWVFIAVVYSLSHGTESSKPVMVVSEKDRRHQRLRESLEPPTKTPLTAKQHLEAAKRLLAQIDANEQENDKADVLMELISAHLTEAGKDARTKSQLEAVLKLTQKKMLDVAKAEVWRKPGATISAQVACKMSIESHLLAPSTADFGLFPDIGRWRDHPGYFLVTYTVDAQNGFGAKIRARYQCRVFCLTENACEVSKITEAAR